MTELEKLLKKQARIAHIVQHCKDNPDSAYVDYLSNFMTEYALNKEKIADLEKDLGL